MAVAKEDVVSFIDNMTVLEMSEFVKELEEKYGVTAAAPAVAVAAALAPSPVKTIPVFPVPLLYPLPPDVTSILSIPAAFA